MTAYLIPAFVEDWQMVELDRMCRDLGTQLARALPTLGVYPAAGPAVLACIDASLDEHLQGPSIFLA